MRAKILGAARASLQGRFLVGTWGSARNRSSCSMNSGSGPLQSSVVCRFIRAQKRVTSPTALKRTMLQCRRGRRFTEPLT